MRYIIVIVPRKFGEGCADFLAETGVHTVFSVLGNGTAQKRMLDYLGLEDTDKVLLFAVAADELAHKILGGLVKRNIDAPGNGIALTIPIDSIGGAYAVKYLTHGQNAVENEVKKMDSCQYSLIVAIAEAGCVDMVMAAARDANARGGTVVHAKSVSNEITSKFFGVSIASEREMILIVAKQADKAAIMRAIMDKAGMDSDAHAVVLSLPVDSVAGLRSVLPDAPELS